jgi:hypothetical protein
MDNLIKVNRKDSYVKYAHQLVDIHLSTKAYVEAANALMIHANQLQWSDDVSKY